MRILQPTEKTLFVFCILFNFLKNFSKICIKTDYVKFHETFANLFTKLIFDVNKKINYLL